MTKLISLIMIHVRGAEQLSGVHDPSQGEGGRTTFGEGGGAPLEKNPAYFAIVPSLLFIPRESLGKGTIPSQNNLVPRPSTAWERD